MSVYIFVSQSFLQEQTEYFENVRCGSRTHRKILKEISPTPHKLFSKRVPKSCTAQNSCKLFIQISSISTVNKKHIRKNQALVIVSSFEYN